MTAILSAIYCWLQGFFLSLNDWVLSWWDSLLSIVDGLLEAVGSGGFGAIPSIAQEYAWVLGAMGVSQALAILATAMGTRFLLQSIPFVRWGGLMGVVARVIGGGAQEVTQWCAVKFWLPYLVAGLLLWWASKRPFGC